MNNEHFDPDISHKNTYDSSTVKHFKDLKTKDGCIRIIPEVELDSRKYTLNEIIDEPILVTKITEKNSKFKNGTFKKIEFMFKNPKSSTYGYITTGARTIVSQIDSTELEFPFETTIKEKKYKSARDITLCNYYMV